MMAHAAVDVVNDVVESSVLQKLSFLGGASQFLTGPFRTGMKEWEQRCSQAAVAPLLIATQTAGGH
jgi:Ca2+/H+ antiporter